MKFQDYPSTNCLGLKTAFLSKKEERVMEANSKPGLHLNYADHVITSPV